MSSERRGGLTAISARSRATAAGWAVADPDRGRRSGRLAECSEYGQRIDGRTRSARKPERRDDVEELPSGFLRTHSRKSLKIDVVQQDQAHRSLGDLMKGPGMLGIREGQAFETVASVDRHISLVEPPNAGGGKSGPSTDILHAGFSLSGS